MQHNCSNFLNFYDIIQVTIEDNKGDCTNKGVKMGEEIRDAIRQDAQDPLEVESDGTIVTQRDLVDQIAADKYLASKDATRKTGLGIKRTKMMAPGAV